MDKIKLEASEKSSLRFLNTLKYEIGEVHYVWKNAGFNLMAIKKAGMKARLMTGTYVLQSNRAKFNQYSVNPTCLLCGEDPEDLEHFLLKCRALTVTRDPFMEKTICLLNDYLGMGAGQLGPETTRTRPLGTIKSRTKTTRPSSRDNSAQFKRQLGPNENSISDPIFSIYRRSIKQCLSGQWLHQLSNPR